VPEFLSKLDSSRLVLEIDTSVYSLSSIFRASYIFTDRCYIFLARSEEAKGVVLVVLSGKDETVNLEKLGGAFFNELVDQNVREGLSRESGELRTLIVAQAFAEGNLLDADRDEGDYKKDPLGISRRR